jgi:hypothetical protein
MSNTAGGFNEKRKAARLMTCTTGASAPLRSNACAPAQLDPFARPAILFYTVAIRSLGRRLNHARC